MAEEATVLTDLNGSGDDRSGAVEPPDAGYTDLLGNGRLWKKTLAEGRGRDSRPQTGDQVTLSFEGRLQDGTLVELETAFTMAVGECEFIQAFDIAALSMELDERCQLLAAPQYAYGSSASVATSHGVVPPGSVISYTVTLLAVDDPVDYAAVGLAERLRVANKKREHGNDLYNREDYMSAINCYGKAAKILEDHCSGDMSDESPELAQQVLDLKVRIYNNMAATQMKIGAHDAAIVSCDAVLRLQPDNVKALFRKGKSLLQKAELTAGLKVLRSALERDPDSRLVQNEVAKATLELRRQQAANNALYKRMIGVRDQPREAKSSSLSSAALWARRHAWLLGATVSLLLSASVAGAAYKFAAS